MDILATFVDIFANIARALFGEETLAVAEGPTGSALFEARVNRTDAALAHVVPQLPLLWSTG